MPKSELSSGHIKRLDEAKVIWVATVRPNGSPHLVPIWHVILNGRIYICTSRSSVKAKNIASNPQVAISLEDGLNPLVVQGSAKIMSRVLKEIVEGFRSKFKWDITSDSTYDVVIEITPSRVIF